MKTKHTAGPWRWRNDVNSGEFNLSPGILETSLSDGTPWGDDIDRANATLISAAPDLLDELEAQADGCSAIIMMMEGQSSPVARTLVSMLKMQENAARAAIAKATGEPQ